MIYLNLHIKPMNIQMASVDMAENIVDMLISRFAELNAQLGYDKYKTDREKILRKVVERLTTNSEGFVYFVLMEEDVFKGFVNCLVGQGVAEIVALELVPSSDTEENAMQLISYAIDYFRKNNISNVLTEVSSRQISYFNALKKVNAKHIESKFNISIQ